MEIDFGYSCECCGDVLWPKRIDREAFKDKSGFVILEDSDHIWLRETGSLPFVRLCPSSGEVRARKECSMSLRLRTGPPRRQRNLETVASIGVALAAVVAFGFGASRCLGGGSSTGRSVRIEQLDGVAAEALLPPRPKPFLDRHRIVSYYGNPLASQMGILGEYEPDEVVRRLRS